jgi:hypothetical protein
LSSAANAEDVQWQPGIPGSLKTIPASRLFLSVSGVFACRSMESMESRHAEILHIRGMRDRWRFFKYLLSGERAGCHHKSGSEAVCCDNFQGEDAYSYPGCSLPSTVVRIVPCSSHVLSENIRQGGSSMAAWAIRWIRRTRGRVQRSTVEDNHQKWVQ